MTRLHFFTSFARFPLDEGLTPPVPLRNLPGLHMIRFTPRETMLAMAIFLTLIIGVTVRHFRHEARPDNAAARQEAKPEPSEVTKHP